MATSKSRLFPRTQDIDGEACCLYFSPTLYRAVPDFQPQDGDIVQVTYPRSGTHWVQQIIQLIVNKGESVKSFVEFLERAPFLETQEVSVTAPPRLLRTHLPMTKLCLSQKAKYVYVARNPWDVCVSCYHLVRESPEFEFENGTFDDFVDAFLDAKVGFGDYFDHVFSGYDRRNESNVFFVTYEELQKNKVDVVFRLARFLGDDYGKRLEEDEDILNQVLQKSTVDFMKHIMRPTRKEIHEALARNSAEVQPDAVANSKTAPDSSVLNILRKGQVGDWRQHFSAENIAKMQAKIDERTRGSDIMYLWKQE